MERIENKIENHVTSLDLSRRLAGLGVNIKSHFTWFPEIAYAHQEYLGDVEDKKGEMTEEEDARMPIYESKVMSVNENKWYVSCDEKEEYRQPTYPAYLASEIAGMLPWDIVIARNIDKDWIVTYQAHMKTESDVYSVINQSITEALGLMLVHLLETDITSANG